MAARLSPRAGPVAVGLGTALVVVGLFGGLADRGGDGGSSGGDRASVDPTAVTGPAEAPDPTEPASTDPPETPQEFYALLEAAFRAGDVDTLVGRLHPSVVGLYGEEQCRAFLASQPSDRAIEVVEIGPTEPFDFGARDNVDLVIEDTLVVVISQVIEENAVESESHVFLAGDGTFRWFTDCGAPAS